MELVFCVQTDTKSKGQGANYNFENTRPQIAINDKTRGPKRHFFS